MDTFTNVLLWGGAVLGVSLAVALVLGRFSGSNEDGNDDHELTDPPDSP